MANLILIVDDSQSAAESWSHQFRDKNFDVIWADTVEKATKLFTQHEAELIGIVMDACVPGDRPTTLGLVEHIRLTFKGHMVAASSIEEYRKLLQQAGCDLEANKLLAPQVLIKAIEADRKG